MMRLINIAAVLLVGIITIAVSVPVFVNSERRSRAKWV